MTALLLERAVRFWPMTVIVAAPPTGWAKTFEPALFAASRRVLKRLGVSLFTLALEALEKLVHRFTGPHSSSARLAKRLEIEKNAKSNEQKEKENPASRAYVHAWKQPRLADEN
jgi:hypothetical protein